MKLFWLMAAGALGAAARYGMTLAIQGWLSSRGSQFPLATLVINVLGSLLASFVVTLAVHEVVRPEWRLIVGTGFLGAFTTFSTFELEAEALISDGRWLPASIYIGGNLVFGFIGILVGRALAFRLIA